MSYLRTTYPKLKVVKANCGDYIKAVTFETFKLFGMKPGSFYDGDAGRAARLVPLPVIDKTPLALWCDTANFIYSVHPRTSIEALLATIPHDADIAIVGDMRRVLEADAFKERGGYLVRVDRPGRQPVSNIDAELLGYTKWDAILCNDGSLSVLEQNVRVICERLVC